MAGRRTFGPSGPTTSNSSVPSTADCHQQSIYYRFFSPIPTLPEPQLHRLAEVDYCDRFALVAELDAQVVAVVRYDRDPAEPIAAEVAFVVADDQQRRGLATVMLEHLAGGRGSNGIERFDAETLPDNRPMMDVFRHAGFNVTSHFESGVIAVSFSFRLRRSSTSTSRNESERQSLHRSGESSILVRSPWSARAAPPGRSATSSSTTWFEAGFTGAVLPVNPHAQSIGGIHAYASVSDLPTSPDLAIIVVPADAVGEVIAECGVSACRWHRDHQRRLRGARRRWARGGGRSREVGPAIRHAGHRAQLHGIGEHRPRSSA